MRLALLGCVAAFLTVLVPAHPAAQPLASGTWVGRAAVGDPVAFAMLNVAGGDSPAVLALPLERKAHPLAMSIRDGRILLESTDGAGFRLEGGDAGEFLRAAPARAASRCSTPTRGRRCAQALHRLLSSAGPAPPVPVPLVAARNPALDVLRRRGSRRCRVSCRRGRLRGRRRLLCALSGTGAHPHRPRGRDPPTALRWREAGTEREAPRVPLYDEQPAEFRSGDVTLAGSLLLPRTPGRRPAVVLVHGSREGDRYALLMHAAFLLRHGVALLAYDKRGVGGSGGDWRSASIPQLAGDAEEAVQWLKGRAEINPGQIGLLGLSEGGGGPAGRHAIG